MAHTRNKNWKTGTTTGFTLIELIVVMAIIALTLSTLFNLFNGVESKSRDVRRRADMIQIQTALELYKQDFGTYPANIARDSVTYPTPTGANSYIPGLAPTYIKELPKDPSGLNYFDPNGNLFGYVYGSDSTGTNYVFFIHILPESYPTQGQNFYDPIRPTWAWKIYSGKQFGEPGCTYGAPDFCAYPPPSTCKCPFIFTY